VTIARYRRIGGPEPRVAAAILAAGDSQRLGRPMQMLSVDGRPLVRLLAETALDSSCNGVAVVVGAHSDLTIEALHGLPLSIVPNPEWSEGVASSIRTSVDWARSRQADALLITACEQPRLTAAHIDRLVRTWRSTPNLMVASRYNGELGVPAVFERACFPALASLFGNQNPQALVRAARVVIAIDWPDGAYDVDTDDLG
jgi:molybdenum cofactor cytidylyltransferase